MELSARVLNRTLLTRRHLLERTAMSVAAMVEYLVGLQAQENQPPYVALAARLVDLDPYDVTRGLESAALVRLLSLRSTVHLLVADDAPMLRQFTRPVHDRERTSSPYVKPAPPPSRAATSPPSVPRRPLISPPGPGCPGCPRCWPRRTIW